jgi:hypothetical protein
MVVRGVELWSAKSQLSRRKTTKRKPTKRKTVKTTTRVTRIQELMVPMMASTSRGNP